MSFLSAGEGVTPEALLQLAASPPADQTQRFALYEAARKLMLAVEDGMTIGSRVHMTLTAAALAQVDIDLKIFEFLAAEPTKRWTTLEVAERTGAESSLTDRVMRGLAVHGMIREADCSVWTASHLTARCASAAFRAGLAHSRNITWPGLQALPEFLAAHQYRNPNHDVDAPAMMGVGFKGGNVMDYLKLHPQKAADTFAFMAENKKEAPKWVDGRVPEDDLVLSDSDVRDGRVMFVDVGGGSGHQCIALRQTKPHLRGRVVLQDVDFMVKMIDRENARAKGFEPMVHDFFQPQPLRAAKVYYMRNVIHDWDDERAAMILRHTRAAMGPDSVLFIDEIVLPARGANSRQVHMDLAVMVYASAMERTTQQWQSLLEATGFVVRDQWTYDEQNGAAVIAAVPRPTAD